MTISALASRIDRDVLAAIAPRVSGSKSAKQAGIIAGFAEMLPDLLQRFAVTSALRIEHLLSQVAHECDGFCTLEEYASGAAYEGRKDLGNTEPGDGKRFKGRCPLQLTGRDNYRKFTAWLRSFIPDCPDFVAQPELVARFPWAAWGVFYYWASRGLNAIADADDLVLLTKRINGGTNGLADRRAYLTKAKLAVGRIEASLIASSQTFPVLRRGAQGDDVVKLQRALRASGHYLLSIDGDFGPGTEGAVKFFQRSLGLVVDGMVGRLTWAALEPFFTEDTK